MKFKCPKCGANIKTPEEKPKKEAAKKPPKEPAAPATDEPKKETAEERNARHYRELNG